MRILRAADYRRMPWKNGGGETREVMVSPPGATLDTLDWRISLATIDSDGPFSIFPGIQRTLCVIRGDGIRLRVGNAAPKLLLRTSEPFTFDGGEPASSALFNGSIVDLNVMSRRNRIRHRVQSLMIDAPLRLNVSASALVVFCQHGTLRCVADANVAHLEAEDCVAVDSNTPLIELSAIAPAAIVVIELFEEH